MLRDELTGHLLPGISLGAVIGLLSGIMFFQEKIVGSNNFLPSSSSYNSIYHLVCTFFGILLTFSPMHFLGFNVMPRRIPDFPDYFNSWNYLSSIGSGITLISFGMLIYLLVLLSSWAYQMRLMLGRCSWHYNNL